MNRPYDCPMCAERCACGVARELYRWHQLPPSEVRHRCYHAVGLLTRRWPVQPVVGVVANRRVPLDRPHRFIMVHAWATLSGVILDPTARQVEAGDDLVLAEPCRAEDLEYWPLLAQPSFWGRVPRSPGESDVLSWLRTAIGWDPAGEVPAQPRVMGVRA